MDSLYRCCVRAQFLCLPSQKTKREARLSGFQPGGPTVRERRPGENRKREGESTKEATKSKRKEKNEKEKKAARFSAFLLRTWRLLDMATATLPPIHATKHERRQVRSGDSVLHSGDKGRKEEQEKRSRTSTVRHLCVCWFAVFLGRHDLVTLHYEQASHAEIL